MRKKKSKIEKNELTGNNSENYTFVMKPEPDIPEEFIQGMTECLSGDVIEGEWDGKDN